MTKEINIGKIKIGGNNKIAVQSMTNTSPLDAEKTILQINQLENAGFDIIRVAVPSKQAADLLPKIIKNINLPLVADIHFDYKLAVSSIKNGASKIRINPGNIGNENNIKYLADCAKEYNVPIRVGANSGSIEKEFTGLGLPVYKQLAESALKHVRLLEKFSFNDIVISVKSSSVKDTIEAYEYISKLTEYPLHLGVTEAGTYKAALVKSAIGIGSLLIKGIGDTIRVSITGDPLQEIEAAKSILKAAGKMPHAEIISCPTCGRCNYDMLSFVNQTEDLIKDIIKPLKIAVMGCVVNGPGEAKDADIGIAGGGENKMAIFCKGKILKTVSTENAFNEFTKELKKLI